MAHYESQTLGVSFEVPDRFSVREQLAFRAAVVDAEGQTNYERYWQAAQTIVTTWSCELIPDPAALDLDAADDYRIANIVQWAANTVAGHMLRLETPPKN